MLHDLCVGKTGTITKAEMNVRKFQIGDATQLVHEHNREETPDYFNERLDISREHKDFIIECMLNNTDVRIEMNDKEFKYEPKGDPVEVGMVKFLIDNDIDVPNRLIERNKFHQKLAILPFDQDLKRMTTIRQVGDRIVVYSKGAPEYLMNCCDQVLSTQFNYVNFHES
jgi:Ca2+-transporting ATPase